MSNGLTNSMLKCNVHVLHIFLLFMSENDNSARKAIEIFVALLLNGIVRQYNYNSSSERLNNDLNGKPVKKKDKMELA